MVMAGGERDPGMQAYLRGKYRLNDPVIPRYVKWRGNALPGDKGICLRPTSRRRPDREARPSDRAFPCRAEGIPAPVAKALSASDAG